MKKNILLSGLVALLAIFSGCEMNEEPKSEASVDMVFSSENGLKTYTYSFYNVLPSRGSAFRRDCLSRAKKVDLRRDGISAPRQ